MLGGKLAALRGLLVTALMGTLLVPGPAFALTGHPPPPGGGPGCDAVTYGNVNVQPGFSEITGGGGVTCRFPVPSGTTTSGNGRGPWTEVPANRPQPNDPCVMRAYQPVRLQVGGPNSTGPNEVQGFWKDPEGQSAWDGWDDDKYQDIWLPDRMHYNAHRAGNNDVLATYKYVDGRYDQNLQCTKGKWIEVNANDQPCNTRGDSIYIPQGSCATAAFHKPVQVDNPLNPPRMDYIVQLLDRIRLNLAQGAIHSSPDNQGAVQGLVALPTRFWIAGVAQAGNREFVITIPGTPDASGRAIVYQYVVRVGLAGTTWNFDDGTGTHPGPSDPGTAAAPAMSHTYAKISATGCQTCGPNRTYHVTATLNYRMDVWAVWNDGTQTANPVHVDQLSKPFDASVQPEDFYVGQIQGVPFG